jgi:SSS family solute:Na+ symporter
MDYMQAIFSWVNAPLFATMLLGMFMPRITPAGAFWGLILGMLSSFGMYLAVKFGWMSAGILTLSSVHSDMAANFWRAWWAWLICLVATLVISGFTKPRPRAELTGLVVGLTPREEAGPRGWHRAPGFWAAVSLVVFVALNIYFW